jgi:hypothetical protein
MEINSDIDAAPLIAFAVYSVAQRLFAPKPIEISFSAREDYLGYVSNAQHTHSLARSAITII